MYRALVILVLLALNAAAQPPANLFADAEKALKSGDYAAAIDKASRAAASFIEQGQKQQARGALSVAGAASAFKGDYPPALDYFNRALKLDRELGDTAGEITRLNNIAGVHSILGRYADAYREYRTAIDRLTGNESRDWYIRSKQLSLTNLAILHQTLGQDARALEIYRELRALPLELAPSIEAQLLTNLAIVYRRLGDPRKALETYEQARKLFDRDPHAAALLYTLRNIGVVKARDLDQPGEALATFEEALALARRNGNMREVVQEQLFLGETLLRMNQPEAALRQFEAANTGATSLKLVDEHWTALAGLGRALEATGQTAAARTRYEEAIRIIESARASLTSSLREEFLAAKRDVYDATIRLMVNDASPDLNALLRRMEQGRARNLKDARGANAQPLDIATLQSRLPAGTALLEYWMAPGHVAVLWITRDQAGVVAHTLTPAQEAALDRLVRAHGELAVPADLRAAVFGNDLLDRLKGIDHLRIASDGLLTALPFELMPVEGPHLALERFTISYLPSAQFVAGAGAAPRWRWPWQATLTVFADPIPGAGGGLDLTLPRLPESALEAQDIARLTPGRVVSHIGEANRRTSFLTLGAAPTPLLHFATHALVDWRDSRRSRLIFSANDSVFRDEVAALNLAGVKLVTLAACESEQGKLVRGEGLQGFSRAFLTAGAEATIGSLWKVSDQATRQFMERFYGHLRAGVTPAEALRATKLEFIRSGTTLARPTHWAAFVLTGDGQGRLDRVVPWWALLMAAAVALGGMVWAVRGRAS